LEVYMTTAKAVTLITGSIVLILLLILGIRLITGYN